jgi:hypothetical protein
MLKRPAAAGLFSIWLHRLKLINEKLSEPGFWGFAGLTGLGRKRYFVFKKNPANPVNPGSDNVVERI